MIRVILGVVLVSVVLWAAGVFKQDATTTISSPPVVIDAGLPSNDGSVTNADPPGGNPGATVTYTVAHGDILEDGDCHLRVFGPGEPVTISSRGIWKTQPITVTSEAELYDRVEALRATVAQWSRTGTCPNG